MHKNMIKSNQSAIISIKQAQVSHHSEDLDTLHMGVAVPVSSEDVDKELNSKPIVSSTQKDGISTWILLSGGKNSKTSPTTENPIRSSIRYESKIEKVTKIKPSISTTMKPKFKTTSTPSITPKAEHIKSVDLNISNNLKQNQQSIQIRSKKTTTTNQPSSVTKKIVNKKTLEPSKIVSITPAPPTSVPTTTPITLATTVEPFIEPTSTTIESTTFLIMEPKDADFDLPQDRSPGTTKKPKKIKTKKNKTKSDTKKPSKTQLATKDKPLSTKIYNYLAREVMPTVGVGLVGLTVAAGLATYFLAPFGALRRSYDDAADRKDDMYYYNNEEYAGPDGQLEEEAFGKVIAGMPVNSPYRNSIRYTVQQQPSQQQLRQPQNPRPGAKFVHYPPQSPQYRVRNVAPVGYPSVVQQQYNSYQQQPNHPSNPVYTKRHDQYPQQFYRYNDDPAVGMYRKNSNFDIGQQQQQNQQKQVQNPEPVKVDAQKSDENTYDSENSYSPTIVTAEPYYENSMPGTDIKMLEDNVLSKRTQFVVGTTVDGENQQSENEDIVKDTVDIIPEHGPRKRRRRDVRNRRQNVYENEIDSEINDNKLMVDSTTHLNLETEDNLTSESSTYKIPTKPNNIGTTDKTPLRPNIVDLIRELFEVKVRMGLSFLQRTTMAVQKYLKNVERRVDESNIFQNKKKSMETKKTDLKT